MSHFYDRLQSAREALTPECHVGHMVFGTPDCWSAYTHQLSSRQLLEKGILADMADRRSRAGGRVPGPCVQRRKGENILGECPVIIQLF